MRIRKCLALVGAIIIFIGCIIIYRMTDYTLYLQEQSVQHFKMVQESHRNEAPDEIKKLLDLNMLHSENDLKKKVRYKHKCSDIRNNLSVDIEVNGLYNKINFENLDGGVWKQGWDIEMKPEIWRKKKKLKVFIVPHSHNDPGWLKTFEDYYSSETRDILNNMLKQMVNDSKKAFIWAEISFFSLWWNELSEEDQGKVRRLIERKQLELVTGGWVMNDEANTHYYSMIAQLTEGHQWMKLNVNATPKNGWTIDPFGESPVMAYLLKKTGVENLVIQRVHYSVKKYLAQTKNLEFYWRQSWDQNAENDILVHMTPFYSYDIPHTCGPDPKICCQFDFKRLPGNALSCPWGENPKPITKNNVALRAELLLDQYRKKAELYRSRVLLVPLGDDFRYQTQSEWSSQFENYYKIMLYVNSNPGFNAEIKFGTLEDFFTALRMESEPENFPSLSGDFFTYADRDDHYWSGYYTSRPFYKRMDRILMGYHRAAEIIFSLGWSAKTLNEPSWLLKPQSGFVKMLREARRSLSLFQHHDGITGTARDNVMEDYATKMMNAISYSKHVIQQVSHYLLSNSKFGSLHYPERVYFEFDDEKTNLINLSQRKVIVLGEGDTKTVVFYNSLSYERKELVSFLVSSPFVQVVDKNGNTIQCQMSPFFSRDGIMEESRYEVSFVVQVPALGLTSYKIIRKISDDGIAKNSFSKMKIFNAVRPVKVSTGFEDVEIGTGREFFIENQMLTIAIHETGLIKGITFKDTMDFLPVRLDFVSYGARPGKERSGAYLFLPDGEATVMVENQPLIRVFDGPLFVRLELQMNNVKHFLIVHRTPHLIDMGIEIINFVDISQESNYELAMRLSSNVKSGTQFYSDLNGFQMTKRFRHSKLPLQGNFYPMPTAAYIEDEIFRITVLTGQPLGASSLRSGELEILQDRRLKQDDNRGLGQGVLDNKITPNIFRLVVEKRIRDCKDLSSSLSINAYLSSQSLLNPIYKMIPTPDVQATELSESYIPVEADLAVDLHLVGVRTFDEEEAKPSAGFHFFRTLLNTCFLGTAQPTTDGVINLHSFIPNHFDNEMKKTSLSFLKVETSLDKRKNQTLCHMEFLSLTLS